LDKLADFSPLWQKILQKFKVSEQLIPLTGCVQPSDLNDVQNTLSQLLAENLPKDANGSIVKKIISRG